MMVNLFGPYVFWCNWIFVIIYILFNYCSVKFYFKHSHIMKCRYFTHFYGNIYCIQKCEDVIVLNSHSIKTFIKACTWMYKLSWIQLVFWFVSVTFYDVSVVIEAAALTAAVTIALTVYTMQSKNIWCFRQFNIW